MGAYKDKGGRWYVSVRYKNWLGEPSRKTKRGFATKRDALAWEREFLQKSAGSLDMTFNSFYEVYQHDLQNRIRQNTWVTKSSIIEKKILPQVKELLTEYGELCLIWFDTPIGIPAEVSKELFDTVKKYQPECLVNSRLGNDFGDYDSLGDNELPDTLTDRLVEAPITLNHTWGYKSFDEDYKSADEVRAILDKCKKCGANLLLNIGPDPLGRLPAPALEILSALAKEK